MAYINNKKISSVFINGNRLLIDKIIESCRKTMLEIESVLVFNAPTFAGDIVQAVTVSRPVGEMPLYITLNGEAVARIPITPSGTLTIPIQLIGNAQSREAIATAGEIVFTVTPNGTAVIASQEAPTGGEIGFSIGLQGTAHDGSAHNVDGVIGFAVGVLGEAITAEGVATDGEIAFSVDLQGLANACNGVGGNGALSFYVATVADISTAEQIIRTVYDFVCNAPQMIALAEITQGNGIEGSIESAVSFDGNITAEGYTVTENEAGGLTYDITASVYEYDGNTLKVWRGENASE